MVDIREQIAQMALSGSYRISEIARRFDVSRPTVYAYRDRYRAEGRAGDACDAASLSTHSEF